MPRKKRDPYEDPTPSDKEKYRLKKRLNKLKQREAIQRELDCSNDEGNITGNAGDQDVSLDSSASNMGDSERSSFKDTESEASLPMQRKIFTKRKPLNEDSDTSSINADDMRKPPNMRKKPRPEQFVPTPIIPSSYLFAGLKDLDGSPLIKVPNVAQIPCPSTSKAGTSHNCEEPTNSQKIPTGKSIKPSEEDVPLPFGRDAGAPALSSGSSQLDMSSAGPSLKVNLPSIVERMASSESLVPPELESRQSDIQEEDSLEHVVIAANLEDLTAPSEGEMNALEGNELPDLEINSNHSAQGHGSAEDEESQQDLDDSGDSGDDRDETYHCDPYGEEEGFNTEQSDDPMTLFFRDFNRMRIKAGLNHSQSEAVWEFFKEKHYLLAELEEETGRGLPVYRTVRRRIDEFIPEVYIDTLHSRKNPQQGEKSHTANYNQRVIKMDQYPRNEFKEEVRRSKSTLKEIIRMHDFVHDASCRNEDGVVPLILSYDGVPDSSSSDNCLCILGVKFPHCQATIHWQTIESKNGEKYLTPSELLDPVHEEVKMNNAKILYYTCDKPMRSYLACLKYHGADSCCEYCQKGGKMLLLNAEEVGAAVQECEALGIEYNGPKKKWKMCYRPEDMGQLRTEDTYKETVAQLKEKQLPLERGQHVNGFRDISPVVKAFPEMNLFECFPTEKMHLLDLGLTVRMVRETWNFPKVKSLGRNDLNPTKLSKVISEQKLPSEMPRRSNEINVQKYKASEWRTLITVHGPIILNDLRGHDALAECFACYVYLYRAYSLEDDEYNEILTKDTLGWVHETFNTSYSDSFGVEAMTYNFHAFMHVNLLRKLGPLPTTSGYSFEGGYQKFKLSLKKAPKASAGKSFENHTNNTWNAMKRSVTDN